MHPILFHIGPIPIRAYGALILIGFFLALRYAMAEARRLSQADERATVKPDHVFDMAIFGLFAGLVGTRLVYVALHWDLFADNPVEILKIWTGGLSFIGAPLFGFGYAWLYCRRHRLPFSVVADIGAPGFALGYTFGRIGCFLNGCCHGSACDLPWAVRFHADGASDALTVPSHPTQIYAAIMSLGIFWALHRMRRRPHPDGSIVVTYLLLYAVYRFINDFFRAGATSRIVLWGLTDGQVVATAAAPVLIFWLWRLYRSRR
ncbi:MAG: prolipoprotein diacylglyceryl transferase [Chthonomonadales bacterium]|nr:prolipoprotein diacylglyceryl transferase [Chthonomonadales bacterium]